MESKSYALWTGIFTLGLLLLLAGVVAWISSKGQTETVTYTFVARRSVSGLNREAQVLLRGIPIGRVTDLRIDPNDRQQVVVKASIDANAPVTDTMYGKLKPQGITGLMFLELYERGIGRPLPPNGRPIPLRPSDLQEIGEAVNETVTEVKRLSANLNSLLNKENQRHIGSILARLDDASAELPALVHDTRAAAQRSQTLMTNVERAATGVDRSIKGINRDFHYAVGRVDEIGTQLNRTLAGVEGGVNQLSNSLVPETQQLMQQIDRTARSLDILIQKQNRNPSQLLFGKPTEEPGPGETGYETP